MSTYSAQTNIASGADGSSAHYNQALENTRYLYDRAGRTVLLTADLAATTSTTLADTTGLSFSVLTGLYYRFFFQILFTSATATTGIKIGLTTPTFTIFTGTVRIPIAADGTAGETQGWLTTSGDSVSGSDVPATGTVYSARIDGLIIPSADGTLQVQHAAEAAAAGNVIVKQGSNGWLSLLG